MNADLVIVGGGLVGASLAAAVCSHPAASSLSVVLVDPSPPDFTKGSKWPATSLRTSTINPSSQAFLSDIGAWYHIPPTRIAPVDSMLIWDSPQPFRTSVADSAERMGVMHFRAADINEEVLAYVIDNDTLRHAIFHTLQQLGVERGGRNLSVVSSGVRNIHFMGMGGIDGKKVVDEENDGLGEVVWPVVELEDGARINARLLVACDGSRSRVRALAGGDWFARGYGERAVVANVRVSDASHVAFQRFLETGPVALLPVASDASSMGNGSSGGPLANVVWTTTDAEARALAAADDATFLDELNVALSAPEFDTGANDTYTDGSANEDDGDVSASVIDELAHRVHGWLPHAGTTSGGSAVWRLPDVPLCAEVVGRRASFPLVAGHAPRYVLAGRRTVLVGDAAHCVHPLAGQGVNLGFADARALAECVAAAAACGRDLGGEQGAPLHSYEVERMPANLLALSGLHALHAAFSLAGPARSVRRLGLSAVHSFSPLKRSILRLMR